MTGVVPPLEFKGAVAVTEVTPTFEVPKALMIVIVGVTRMVPVKTNW